MNEVQGKALSVFHCIQLEKGSQGSAVGTRPLLAQNPAAPNISTNMVSNNGDLDKIVYDCAIGSHIFRITAYVN